MTPRRVLVTGGIRSGKSRFAESLLAAEPQVSYVAPGPRPDPVTDPDWAARIALHRSRRPPGWQTVETVEVAAAVRSARDPVLLDDLGTWLTRSIDGVAGWERPLAEWSLADRFADLTAAVAATPVPVVIVTNEVGWGLVSEHRSGRIFTDLLGRLNQQVADVCDEVVLLVAGRPLRL